ncbi:hypothetical protein [Pseudoponticoccus marisrubri]|uniref:Uncharacterized protein n=1 Tax=Pseudoponticoccus marisrubri TaxID=1685382 RepID=A0A0W7WIS8_9RHOB|nr:hypothetical protein [Pseudoponticoccus marisrubri]KUF10514.1 hypothetical protein AVJ23_11580 [Pseudoponticoccus marisrubri]
MITRIVAAAARALLVALLIAMPVVLLPGASSDTAQMVALLALIAGVLTFVEYVSDFPSLLEFRDAPPFNRMRFIALFATVLALTLINRGEAHADALSEMLYTFGAQVGAAMDFPFSPVRLMVLVGPEDAPEALRDAIRSHAGLAYVISLVTLLCFVALVRLLDWPLQGGPFNFWVNLPLFDPTAGGDVLYRLKRDANVNVALGFLLPFLIPAILKLAASYGTPVSLGAPHSMIWMMSAWAFLPASLIMRGVALMRIADLIEEKRRRAYAQARVQAA